MSYLPKREKAMGSQDDGEKRRWGERVIKVIKKSLKKVILCLLSLNKEDNSGIY